jgi:hypothetical protein
MRKLRYVLFAAVCVGVLALAAAMALGTRTAQGSSKHHGPPVSKEVRHMLKDVDSDNIEHSIRTLASFGTRHTLSSQTDPNRGIGAATNWIYDQFAQYAADSNGRLTVERQSFHPAAWPAQPEPRPGHERDRDAARNPVARPGLPRQRPHRLSLHRRARLHV